MDRKAHWEKVYGSKAPDELSWYQAEATISLGLIESAGVDAGASIIDVGGGDSRLVDDLLALGFQDVSVLDLSSRALERARVRLGERANSVTWLECDITCESLHRRYRLWHDRAVFHFLTDSGDRQSYVALLKESVLAKGHAIIATFALDAPPKCSGLDVVRYSAESLAEEVDPAFELLQTESQLHITPGGVHQPFNYCLFRKRSV
jgi:2-polyprenyl-3-methyl-5-hydroxy-6-metoxy-1,4-benzoquinol methylase